MSDRGELFRRLVENGWSVEDVAKMDGSTVHAVNAAMRRARLGEGKPRRPDLVQQSRVGAEQANAMRWGWPRPLGDNAFVRALALEIQRHGWVREYSTLSTGTPIPVGSADLCQQLIHRGD